MIFSFPNGKKGGKTRISPGAGGALPPGGAPRLSPDFPISYDHLTVSYEQT